MFSLSQPPTDDKPALYAHLERQLRALLSGERDFIANAANTAASLHHTLPAVNWTGFYHWHEGELLVGPFQGKPACVRLKPGKGVCGTAAARRATVLVPDVEAFPGHIACDAASRSEIVVPLLEADRLMGVLDVDSPVRGRFDAEDQAGLERLMALFLAHTDRPGETATVR